MGEFRKFISSLDYLFGCWLLIPASICLIYSEKYLYESIILYIISCAFLLKAAIIDFIPLFSNVAKKPKKISSHNINLITKSEGADLNLTQSKNSENENFFNILITTAYLLGGIFFEAGSILYWPTWTTGRLGTWIFRLGSICYLTGTISLCVVVLKPFDKNSHYLENQKTIKNGSFYITMGCLTFYAYGAIFFIIGGIMSEMHYSLSGQIWLVGSIWFAIGSTLGFVDRLMNY